MIAKYEMQITKILHESGYKYCAYISELAYINDMIGRLDLLYTKPWIYNLLGLPFVKKKYKKLAQLEEIDITDYYMEDRGGDRLD